ncbi:DNA-directed RNA polymerase subunit beta [Evansella sp. AB-rgal1]|uniref:DNA-directed RNA polymerase subunit beta n=1 Tax=Evansella sp. AB-rgal1 TaxID=3242696 RepID=UPI00359D8576
MDKKDLTTQQPNKDHAEDKTNTSSSSENSRSGERNDENSSKQDELSLSLVKYDLETGDADAPVRAVYRSNGGQASGVTSDKGEASFRRPDADEKESDVFDSSKDVKGEVSDDEGIPVTKFSAVLPSRKDRFLKESVEEGKHGNSDELKSSTQKPFYNDAVDTSEGKPKYNDGINSSIGKSLDDEEESSKEEPIYNAKVQSRVEHRRGTEIGDVEQKDYSLAEVEEQDESQMTRRQIRKQKKKEQEREKGLKKAARGRIRAFPIWFRLVIVLLLFAGSLVAGAMFGFGIMGEGSPRDILEPESWYKIYDLIFDGTEMERAR